MIALLTVFIFPSTSLSIYCTETDINHIGVGSIFKKIYFITFPLGMMAVIVTGRLPIKVENKIYDITILITQRKLRYNSIYICFKAICYIGIVYRVRQQNKKSISANRNENLKKSHRHQNPKIPTPPNSPMPQSRKILSSLEVDPTLDPSPLAFAPWSLKYLSKENVSSINLNNKCTKKTRTRLKITIDEHRKNENKCPQNIHPTRSESNVKVTAQLPSIPTLSILVEESMKLKKGLEHNNIVQVDVHRHDTNEQEHETDNNKARNFSADSADFSENENYLKIPTILFGYFEMLHCVTFYNK